MYHQFMPQLHFVQHQGPTLLLILCIVFHRFRTTPQGRLPGASLYATCTTPCPSSKGSRRAWPRFKVMPKVNKFNHKVKHKAKVKVKLGLNQRLSGSSFTTQARTKSWASRR